MNSFPKIQASSGEWVPPGNKLDQIASKCTVLCLVGVMASAGTGGVMSADAAVQTYDGPCNTFQYIENEKQTLALSEQVISIKNAFSLKITEIAELFSVSRPTVYAWLRGTQEPKHNHILEIQRLANIANEANSLNIKRMDLLIRRKVLDGQSLIDKMKDNADVSACLFLIKDIADREELARINTTSRTTNNHGFDDTIDDYSMPYEG